MLRKLSLPLLCSLIPFLCTCDRAPKTLFQERLDTGITSSNQLQETEDWNIVEYLYYYNGGGVAATDINGDDLPDLYFTNNQGQNKYYINEGDFTFRDATDEGGVAGAGDWSTGISVVDVNADGRMDLYVCNVSGYKGLTGRNELFLQNEDGTFTESAADYGLDFTGFNTQAYWFDYDRDGDLDMYLLRHSVHNDATYGTAKSRTIPDSMAGDILLRNDLNTPVGSGEATQSPHRRSGGSGNGFTNVTQQANLFSSKIAYGLSVAIADFNQDSFPDIYVCNDFSENDYYYLNQGDGTFKESVRELVGHTSNFSMGSDVADFNNDRWPDLLTLDMRPDQETILKSTMSADPINVYNIKRELGYHHQLPRNNLQWNRGGGNFSEIAEMAGLAATDWSWSCLIEDFDLDGRQDVFIANGIERRPNSLDYLKFISSDLARSASNLEVIANMPPGQVANQAFRMTGEWAFEEVGENWGLDFVGSSTGAAVADFDGDGDADLVVNNLNAPAKVYENTYVAPSRSPGAAFNPTSPSARRYDPNSRLCPQRGMMSQSEGRYGPDRGTAAKYAPQFNVTPTGFTRTAALGSFFDRSPLAPFKPKPINHPLQLLENGDLAISTDESGQHYDIARWEDEALIMLETAPWLTVKHRLVNQPTMPLWVPSTLTEGEFFAEVFDDVVYQHPDDEAKGLASLHAGIWQSLSGISSVEGTDEGLVAGNWGLNSGLGNPSPQLPIRLYIEDVDGNGQTEPILTYVRQGKEITVADKDELAARVPSLKRNNLNYVDYAKKRFQDLFPALQKRPKEVHTLEHQLFLHPPSSDTWQVESLPRATQITTLNCALEVPQGVLLGGNKHHVQPRIGRQDAAALQLLTKDGEVEFIDLGGAWNHLEVRQLVRLDENHVLVVVAEGEHLLLEW